jgi:hypothetical protein
MRWPFAEVEKYNAQEVKTFLQEWGRARGKELSEFADDYGSGNDLCNAASFHLKRIFTNCDDAIGEELYNLLHVVEVNR